MHIIWLFVHEVVVMYEGEWIIRWTIRSYGEGRAWAERYYPTVQIQVREELDYDHIAK